MLITRYTKIVMVLCLALFCLLVAFDNITDYGTNYPGNALMYRSVTHPALWNFCYWLIIAAEAVAGILFLAGAIRLLQVRHAPGPVFNQAKGLVVAAALVAFLLWFFGFMVIAGEWYAMWQSQTWNGQDAAFRFYVAVLAVLIFVNQADGNLAVAPAQAPAKKAAAPQRKSGRAPARRRTDKGRRNTDAT